MNLIEVPGQTMGSKAWSRLKMRLFDRQGGFCAYCGEPMERVRNPRMVTLDHVIPIREGGTDDESNLVAACHQCNRAKGCMTAEQLRRLANMIDYYAASIGEGRGQ